MLAPLLALANLAVSVAQPPASWPQPLAFVENVGQIASPASYVARRGPLTAFFEPGRVVLDLRRRTSDPHARGREDGRQDRGLRGHSLDPLTGSWLQGSGIAGAIATPHLPGRQSPPWQAIEGVGLSLRFLGASDRARLEGRSAVPGKRTYLDAHSGGRDARAYRVLRCLSLYEGIDLQWREHEGRLEYDLLLAPGADLDEVVILCEGIIGLRVDADGSLVMATARGELRQSPPVTWSLDAAGARIPVACGYRLRGEHSFGFAVADRRPGLDLVVDPGFEWSTYFGGESDDWLLDCTTDSNGRVYFCGQTDSVSLPVLGPYQATIQGQVDAFVTCLDPAAPPAQQLVWSTYLGGSGADCAYAVAVATNGKVLVGGYTDSVDFPGGAAMGGWDGFLVCLDPAQSGQTQRLWTRSIGGGSRDWVTDIALDQGGDVVCVGGTESPSFVPAPGGYQGTFGGSRDAFAVRLSAGGMAQFATYLGGAGTEVFFDAFLPLNWKLCSVAVAQNGITVVGCTLGGGFPVTNGSQPLGGWDVFASRFDPTLGVLLASTYFGGNGNDFADALAVEATGGTVVVGRTWSADLPTTANAWSRVNRGGLDIAVARLDGTLSSQPLYGTYLGGSGEDIASAVLLEDSGTIVVGGNTASADFPVTAGTPSPPNSLGDLVLARLLPEAGSTTLVYSGRYGGSVRQTVVGMAFDGKGGVLCAGPTVSSDFPMVNPYQPGLRGVRDGWAGDHDLLPLNVQRFGTSTPACQGPLWIQVLNQPRAGNAAFATECHRAPPNAPGALLIGVPWHFGVPVLNALAFVGPSIVVPVAGDARGYTRTPLPIPGGVVARPGLAFQYAFVNTPNCPGTGLLSASNALFW